MAPRQKTPDVLDAMVPHVHYEVGQIVDFLKFQNAWCAVLQPDLARLTRNSLLEAALLHFRCVIEFLDNETKGDRVTARDYLPRWKWKARSQLVRVDDLHGRLAHIGIIRAPEDGGEAKGFDWLSWLNSEALAVLAAYRDFLVALRDSRSPRYAKFIAPPFEEVPAVDIPLLDAILAHN